ncbi:MAG: replication initiator protein [Microviridae sp.]|nr:MAG: replication initiator protein [Microviridae sp.]
MPCFKPLIAYGLEAGGVTFIKSRGGNEVLLPCGKCVGCQATRAAHWATRCVNEAALHADNCFLTLTYDERNLPPGGTLEKADFQKFIKRLRKRIAPQRISFFHCGEYGEKLGRPHYHAIIFGYDYPDKREGRKSKSGEQTYTSALLERDWPFGDCNIGSVTYESACYIARYTTKKVFGDDADGHYDGKLPEYITMSRNPAIGRKWIEEFLIDTYKDDTIIVSGRPVKPPRYYDKRLKKLDPLLLDDVQQKRAQYAISPSVRADNTPARLAVKNEVKTLTNKLFSRNL